MDDMEQIREYVLKQFLEQNEERKTVQAKLKKTKTIINSIVENDDEDNSDEDSLDDENHYDEI